MEELQVIETTSGRQFKPWATKDDVQDPASVTGIASEIASGKAAIASAINAKGGEASATESFSELAQDIQNTPTSGVLSGGIVQSEPFSFLDYVCKQGAYPFTEIDDDSVTEINKSRAFSEQTRLLKVKMSKLTTISCTEVFYGCQSLIDVNLPQLKILGPEEQGNSIFWYCANIQNIYLPNLERFNGYKSMAFSYNDNLVSIRMPKCYYIRTFLFLSIPKLEYLEFGTITNVNPNFSSLPKVRDITIGQDTDVNLPFNEWTATNVIAEGQSGIDELNSNLYNNLLTKLYDHSQDGQTRTLRIGWLANVTAENIAYANAKGWTLTT